MVERRPLVVLLSHLVLVLGILIVVFPIYLAFVASTHTAERMLSVPIPLWPGTEMLDNYRTVLFKGVAGASAAPVSRMMFNSLVMAVSISVGKIVISLLSPTGFFLLVVNTIFAFVGTFGVIDSVTKGGPGKATEIMVFKLYNDGFRGQDFGGSAAQSAILMLILIGLTVIQFRYIERRVHY